MISSGKVLSYIFGVFVVVVVGVLAYLSFSSSPDTENATLSTPDTQELVQEQNSSLETAQLEANIAPTQTSYASDLTTFQKALKFQDESECHDVQNDRLRSECFDRIRMMAALEIRELELCNKVSNATIKQTCQDKLITQVAIAETNPSVCLQISEASVQKECFDKVDTQLFVSANTPQNCEQMTNPEQKKQCIDHFRLTDIRSTTDVEVCDGFLTVSGKRECEGYIWSAQALETQDPTLCLNISDRSHQQKCEVSMKTLMKKQEISQGLLEGKSDACANFVDPQLKQQCENEAHYYAAKIYRDPSYCDKIEESSAFQTRCYREITALSDEYWTQKAEQENNPSHCEKLSSPGEVKYCKSLI